MWTLLLLVSSLFPAGISSVKSVFGSKGHSVQINCPYDSQYKSNVKYLCKDKCPRGGNKNILVESGSADKDPRFSLEDNRTASVFIITITDLRTKDTGIYWCGIKTFPWDVFNSEITLLVKLDPPQSTTDPQTTPSTSSTPSVETPTHQILNGSTVSKTSTSGISSLGPGEISSKTPSSTPKGLAGSDTPVYITGGLVVIVIVLLGVLIALYKHKKNHKSSKASVEMSPLNTPLPPSPGEDKPSEVPSTDECIYQEIDEQKPESAMETTVNTIYSTAEEPMDAPLYSTIDDHLTVYSTATLPQQTPISSPSPPDTPQ